MFDVAAVNISANEMGRTASEIEALRTEFEIPFLSANIVEESTGEPYFQTSIKIDVGSRKVGLVGVTDRTNRTWTLADGKTLVTADPVEKARPLVEALSEECDLVILLAHMQMRRIESVVEALPGVDIVLGGDGYSTTYSEKKVGSVLVSYAGRQGKTLGILNVGIDEGGVLAVSQVEMKSLRKSMPEDPDIKALVDAAKEEMLRAATTDSRTAELLEKVNPEYVGFTGCRSCHADAYKIWKGTAHYRAFDSLIEGREVKNSECLPCHTTGYYGGGFVDVAVTPRMVNVQCESCHGPGAGHVKAPQANGFASTPDAETCQRCHDKQNSPNYAFEPYWEKIKH